MKKIFLFSFIFFIILFSFFCFVNFSYPKKYQNLVLKYSKIYSLDKNLVFSIIKNESNFNKNAKSRKGALGLMQLMPKTANWISNKLNENYSDEKLFDAETNIKYGCFYLNYLQAKFNNMDAIISAYNAGEGNVLNWFDEGKFDESNIEFMETKLYLKKVKRVMKIYSCL